VTNQLALPKSFSQETLQEFVWLTARLFWLALQISLPIVVVTLGTQLVLGILGKMMPQLNLILMSFSVTLLTGLFALFLVAPELIDFMEQLFSDMGGQLLDLLKVI
jgi:flagellar biosynthesis protein FliR